MLANVIFLIHGGFRSTKVMVAILVPEGWLYVAAKINRSLSQIMISSIVIQHRLLWVRVLRVNAWLCTLQSFYVKIWGDGEPPNSRFSKMQDEI